MMKKTLLITGLVAGLSFQTAFAAVNPNRSPYDKRIQSINHNPYDVVVVRAKVGYATLVQLEEGETVDVANPVNEGLVTGYGKAWGVKVRGNNIFFKPTKPQPSTNLLMVSNKKRRYSLDLKMADQNHPPTFVLEFTITGIIGGAAKNHWHRPKFTTTAVLPTSVMTMLKICRPYSG